MKIEEDQIWEYIYDEDQDSHGQYVIGPFTDGKYHILFNMEGKKINSGYDIDHFKNSMIWKYIGVKKSKIFKEQLNEIVLEQNND